MYEVDDETLRILDQIEGHPDWYRRKQVYVFCVNKRKVYTAWVYFFHCPQGEKIPSGDYFDYFKDFII